MSWTEDLFQYIEKIDPSFRSRIEGVSKSELDDLQNALGVPVPEVYKEFLLTMGRKDGGIWLGDRFQSDISTILEIIKITKDENPTADFRAFTPIASGDVIEGIALLNKGDDNLSVVEIDHNAPGRYWASSLPGLLFGKAFVMHSKKIPNNAHINFENAGRVIQEFSQQSKELGFTQQWFSDETHYYGIQSEAALMIRTDEKSFNVWIYAQTQKQVKVWLEAFLKTFNSMLSLSINGERQNL